MIGYIRRQKLDDYSQDNKNNSDLCMKTLPIVDKVLTDNVEKVTDTSEKWLTT